MRTDFSKPRRQNLKGIIVIFFMVLIKRLRQNIYAFLPLLSSNIRNNYLHFVIIGAVVLVILQLLYSYKSYLNFRFHIKDGRFFLREGVFKFTDTDIPFERIQNININQNLIQQMLNVVGFEIETAGQGTSEINIKALTREDANALKNLLLEDKNKLEQTTNIDKAKLSIRAYPKSTEPLFRLELGQLLKVGLSSNYLKGFGLVFVFIMSLYQFVEDIFNTVFEVNVDEEYISQLPETLTFIIAIVIIVIIVSFLVTVVNTIIRYFDLKVIKIDNDFEVGYGLFKRVNQVIKKSKTQIFEIEQNPIKDLFKIKNVFISQASSKEVTEKKKIGLVGVSDKHINILFKSLLDVDYPQQFVFFKSSFRLMYRLVIVYMLLILALSSGVYIWQGLFASIFIGSCLLCLCLFIAYKTVLKSHIGINTDMIEIQSGSIHTRKKYISTHKIQSISLKQNLFQQRNGHADLIIFSASGQERVNYLNKEDVFKIVNYLNYKIESSSLSWI